MFVFLNFSETKSRNSTSKGKRRKEEIQKTIFLTNFNNLTIAQYNNERNGVPPRRGGGDSEVVFKEEEQGIGDSTPPTPITTSDMEVIIRGWEEKFERISQCLREVQSASERANSDMCNISREARAQGDEQERRLEAMHAGLTEFLQKCDPAHLPTTHHVDAPTASTPYTPTGIPARLRPEFGFQPSPVGQDEPMESARSTMTHIRDHDDIRSARTRDHDDIRARTRRRNELADEFAENIKNLAQSAYPSADQNMLDNLVVQRCREGHLCLYPSTGLQDLIGACVRFETHYTPCRVATEMNSP